MMQSTTSSHMPTRRWLILTLFLIALSTVLFVTGVGIERATAPPTSTHQQERSGETTSADPDGGHDETPSQPGEQGHGGAETIFRLDLENPWVVGAYVAIWLGLAISLLRLGRIAWAALLGVAILAAVLDMAEVWRQWTSIHLTVATLALLVMLAHVALVVVAGFVLVRSLSQQRPSFN
jgi:hypothetical protein